MRRSFISLGVDSNIALAAEVALNYFVRKKVLKVIGICVTQSQKECTASLRGGVNVKNIGMMRPLRCFLLQNNVTSRDKSARYMGHIALAHDRVDLAKLVKGTQLKVQNYV